MSHPRSSPSCPPGTVAPVFGLGRGTAWRWLFPCALAVMIVLASGRSQIAAPPGIPSVDKLGHFLVFGLLASLVVRSPGGRVFWPLCAVALVSFFGISDEFHQSFTPGRSVEFADWVADTLGAALAVTLYANWGAYRRVLERRLAAPRVGGKSTALAPVAAPVSVSTDIPS